MRHLIAIALLCTLPAGAFEPVRDGAFVGGLVAGRTSIAPGETIDLALRIQHDEGFHTYWKAPGIVGVGTQIDWTDTSGLEPAAILWPQPQRIKMGPYWAYGYEGETFLIVPVTAPASAQPGTTARLKAKVSFMICPAVLTPTESCYPGFVDLELDLPVTEKPGEASEFAEAIGRSRATFASKNTIWNATAEREDDLITLTLQPKKGAKFVLPKTLYFYSDDGTIHSDKPQPVHHHDDGRTTLSLTRSEFAPEGRDSLNGILYTESGHPDGSGARPILIGAPFTAK